MKLVKLLPRLQKATLFFAILLFSNCKKDIVNPEYLPSSNSGLKISASDRTDSYPISATEAKSWFQNQFGLSKHVTRINAADTMKFDIKPVWAFATEGTYGQNTPIVKVPLQVIQSLEIEQRTSYFLIFYKDGVNHIVAELVFALGDDAYKNGSKKLRTPDFSGIVIKMDLSGQVNPRGVIMNT